MKRPIRLTIIATVAAVLVVALVAAAGWWAAGLASAANAGKAEAEAGARHLASLDATGAAWQFGAASRTFSRAQEMLGPDWLGGAVGAVPLVGRQYSAAQALVAIGLDGSTAGAELAAALQEAPATSSTAGPTGRLGGLLTTGRRHIDAALAALGDAADRVAVLEEQGLVPPLASAVRSVKAALREAAPFLDRSDALLSLEKYLLTSKHRILVVSQDGAELRPTGGFAGSYGVIETGPTGVRLEEYHDVYVLPDPPGRVQPAPGMRFTPDLTFRDANWWIDFPTSARVMLKLWGAAGQSPVDGIVAVDTVAMKHLLEVLGPVRVPSYSETFTPENLLTRLLYYTQGKGQVKTQGKDGRKGVLVALAGELEKRVLNAGPADLARSALALAKAADAKHVQMYFTDPGAEAAVIALGWSGRIAPPAGTTDLLAVSNAMNLGSKINMAMKKTIDYRVALKPDRSAESTLVLGYSNTGPFTLPERTVFRDWLRIYRAPGTVFAPGGGGYSTVELGLPTEIRTFSVGRGQTRKETVVSRVPAAWRAGRVPASAASSVPTGGVSPAVPIGVSHYRLSIVRQADLEDIPTTVSITPPPGWRVFSASARLAASGKLLPATTEGGRARLTLPLSGDVVFDVSLAPS